MVHRACIAVACLSLNELLGEINIFFIVELDEWVLKAFFSFMLCGAHNCVVQFSSYSGCRICPALSLRSSRHLQWCFPNYHSSYENYTPLTPTSGFYYMNHCLAIWLEQLVGPECILKSARPIKFFHDLAMTGSPSNGSTLVEGVLDLHCWGCWAAPGPALPEVCVQPCFGFCVRPHERSHKSLLDIFSSLKEAKPKKCSLRAIPSPPPQKKPKRFWLQNLQRRCRSYFFMWH